MCATAKGRELGQPATRGSWVGEPTGRAQQALTLACLQIFYGVASWQEAWPSCQGQASAAGHARAQHRHHLAACATSCRRPQHPAVHGFPLKPGLWTAPEIFLAFGATKTISLVSALILVACNHLSTYVSFWTADTFGRRTLFLQARPCLSSPDLGRGGGCGAAGAVTGVLTRACPAQAGVQMFSALLAIALCLLLIHNPNHGLWEGARQLLPPAWPWQLACAQLAAVSIRAAGLTPARAGWLILGLTCLFDMAYAWSWGPLGDALCPIRA